MVHPSKLEVTTWKNRVDPKHRVFPKGLKTGILSRGRIRRSLEWARWVVEYQTHDPRAACILPKLLDLAPEVDVTIELFQELEKLPRAQHERVFTAYLTQRHARELADRRLYFGVFYTDDMKARLEAALGTKLDAMYERPRVPLPGSRRRKAGEQYFLLTYLSLPTALEPEANCPPPPVTPPPPLDPFEPLIATTSACWNVRDGAGQSKTKVLGAFRGKAETVRILSKQLVGSQRWYEFETTAPLELSAPSKGLRCDGNEKATTTLPAGSRAWTIGFDMDSGHSGDSYNAKGVDGQAASFRYFIEQVRDYERANSSLTLTEKITRLRRLGQHRNLPFDAVIGRVNPPPKGAKFIEDHVFDKARWELLTDYQAVRTPDDRKVDFWHLFVGLDVLGNKIKDHYFLNKWIGANFSAATWSGDIGAAVADTQVSATAWWHKASPNATDKEKFDFYYGTRAPDADLYADVDAWGIHALRRSEQDSLADLLSTYYGTLEDGSDGPNPKSRKDALAAFLHAYKFQYDVDIDYDKYPDALWNQKLSREAFQRQIEAFASFWLAFRKPWDPPPVDDSLSALATRTFLAWLEVEAIRNAVRP